MAQLVFWVPPIVTNEACDKIYYIKVEMFAWIIVCIFKHAHVQEIKLQLNNAKYV